MPIPSLGLEDPLEWVAIPSPGNLPDPGIQSSALALTGGFFTTEPPQKLMRVATT